MYKWNFLLHDLKPNFSPTRKLMQLKQYRLDCNPHINFAESISNQAEIMLQLQQKWGPTNTYKTNPRRKKKRKTIKSNRSNNQKTMIGTH